MHRKRLLLVCLLAISLASPPASAQLVCAEFYPSQPSSNVQAGFGGDPRLNMHRAQTFEARFGGVLQEITLRLFRDPSNTSRGLRVEIRDADGGTPGSTTLAQLLVPATGVPQSPTNVTFDFSEANLLLQEGQAYAVVVGAERAGFPTPYSIYGEHADAYPHGAAYASYDGGSTFTAVMDTDYFFRVTAIPPDDSPPESYLLAAPPGELHIAVHDPESGISSLRAVSWRNALVFLPEFVPGDRGILVVDVQHAGAAGPGQLDLEAINGAGMIRTWTFEVQPKPKTEDCEDVLDYFDQAVAAGDLVAAGPGRSGRGLQLLRGFLARACLHFDRGQSRAACRLLGSAMDRFDGRPNPPDLVDGPARAVLLYVASEVSRSLGCLPPEKAEAAEMKSEAASWTSIKSLYRR